MWFEFLVSKDSIARVNQDETGWGGRAMKQSKRVLSLRVHRFCWRAKQTTNNTNPTNQNASLSTTVPLANLDFSLAPSGRTAKMTVARHLVLRVVSAQLLCHQPITTATSAP